MYDKLFINYVGLMLQFSELASQKSLKKAHTQNSFIRKIKK